MSHKVSKGQREEMEDLGFHFNCIKLRNSLTLAGQVTRELVGASGILPDIDLISMELVKF